MKKRTIYIGLLLIFIIGIISLIGTFATDTTITEGNSSNADYLFNIALGSRTNREVVIPSYDSKVVDIKISNPNPFKMKYLLYLEGTNTNISVINIGDNESIGILNSNTTTLVKIFIQNNSNSNITISIKDLVGFESDELSLPSNSTSIDKGNYYKVKVTSNNYGTVKPSIKLSTTGGTLEYTLVPNTGYQYKSNTCAGSVSNNIMTISNITSNKNCTVEFEAIEVTVSFNLDGGNIEPINYTTPEEHQYTVPYTGNYKLEVWGAQGGKGNNVQSGYGGYSTGTISLDSGDKMYVNVGGMGNSSNTSSSSSVTGGYNGGGNGFGHTDKVVSGGGGATHIATVSGQLKNLSSNISSILIVAGGGGGSAYENTNSIGGSGGGMNGVASQSYNSNYTSTGATQTSSGTGYFPGSFGLGGCNATENGCSGGGGGYYGGDAARYAGGGAGGSGYIGNSLLTNKVMYCYNCTESTATATKTVSTTNVSGTATANYAKSGNGAARITLISDIIKTITYSQSYGELPTPVKTGYAFDGWYTGQNGTGTKITDSTALTIASNHTLYAKWIEDPTISFNLDGGYLELINYTTPQQHTYNVPYTGNYKLEVWGAQGGTVTYSSNNYRGGYGGYSVGNVSLTAGNKLYISVGGTGSGGNSNTTFTGGYNGGGSTNSTSGTDHYHSSGGGATHIATSSGLLSSLSSNTNSILIVAGGGGGGYIHTAGTQYGSIGGSGGGYLGTDATTSGSNGKQGLGGSQTTGGKYASSTETSSTIFGSFGKGGTPSASWGSAGGGGYYGGGASYGSTSSNGNSGGGGGSGYIGNSLLTNKVMYCYNCTESTATATKTISTTNVSGTATSNYAKSGNGAAKISIISGATSKVVYNQTYGELPVPSKIGYTFGGWYTGANGTGTEVTSSTIVTNTSDHTLYAKWIKNPTVSFNLDGGSLSSGSTSLSVILGQTYGELPVPTKIGYTFGGWYTGENGTGTEVTSSTIVTNTSDHTLYAKWIQLGIPSFSYTGSYAIVDDSNGTITDPSTYSGNWKIRFLSSGTLTFSSLETVPNGIDIFIVAGGGKGGTGSRYYAQGSAGGAGGGGGAAITVTAFPAQTGVSYNIVVGAASQNSSFGADSTAYYTALKGGNGGTTVRNDSGIPTYYPGSGGAGRLSGQTGNYGATNVVVKAGTVGNSSKGGNGNYEFFETSGLRYGAGGGGGGWGASTGLGGYGGSGSAGGTNGGGAGGHGCNYNNGVLEGAWSGVSGSANSGSGGGGGGSQCGSGNTGYGSTGSGGNGGSGIVIIRNTRS